MFNTSMFAPCIHKFEIAGIIITDKYPFLRRRQYVRKSYTNNFQNAQTTEMINIVRVDLTISEV